MEGTARTFNILFDSRCERLRLFLLQRNRQGINDQLSNPVSQSSNITPLQVSTIFFTSSRPPITSKLVQLSIAFPLRPLWIFTLSQKLWQRTRIPTFYRGPTAPISEFSHCPRNCDPRTRRPTFYRGPTAPIMNFHIVPETVTQGQGDPLSRGPTAPIYEFSLCPRNCDPRTRRPTFNRSLFAPFLNFIFVPLMLTQR